ncbi:MAG: TlpA family protein disulfide reductase, partial [Thermoanaerobaculia bacterium]
TTREQIESAVPEWVQAEVEAQPDAETARSLAAVAPGAEVTVFLGTWCSDSRREVPRLWKALAEAGFDVPFEVHYIGVDRGKKEPASELSANDVRYLPTFIVRRDGRETGRIVETSPNGIERDLLSLLNNKARGVLTTREDVTPNAAKPPR